jgi:hypothetical protein
MRRLLAVVAFVGATFPAPSRAQLAFPLGSFTSCVKVREGAPAIRSHKVDLGLGSGGFFYPYQGCIVKMPAKLACFSTVMTFSQPGVSATPTPVNQGFYCYKLKCPPTGAPAPSADGKDAFDNHVVALSPRGPQMLCAPAASPSGAFLDSNL